MRGLLRELWPLFAVVALTTVLALQIPRKALFFAPVPPRRQAPFASFATYGPQAYAQLVQKVRMSWQLRAQGFDATAASRVDELDLVEDYPPPPVTEETARSSVPMSSDAPGATSMDVNVRVGKSRPNHLC